MSIGMDRFSSEGSFATFDPYETTNRIAVFALQCRSCGHEPEDVVSAPRVCPKCRADTWERFAKPGSILENSARY